MSLTKPGGTPLWNTNQRVDSSKLNDAGTLAEKSLWDGFVSLVFDSAGFVDLGCFPAKGAGNLDWTVEAGFGVVYSATVSEFQADFQPVYVPSQQSGTLSAHDATDPRIDIITIGPDTTDEETETVKILSGTSLSPTSVDTKRSRTFELTVTEGIPDAAPVQPSTPSGHELVAVIEVPATSGAITVHDARRRCGVKSGALGFRPWCAVPTSIGALAGGVRTVTLQVQDVEGNNLASYPEGGLTDTTERFHFVAELFDDEGQQNSSAYRIKTPVTGWTTDILSNQARVVGYVTASDGVFELDLEDVLSGGDVTWLRITPIRYFNNDTSARGPVGYPTVVRVDF